MLAVWSQVQGAPKIVPWVPVPGDHPDPNTYTVDALLARDLDQPLVESARAMMPQSLVRRRTRSEARTARGAA